MGVTKKQIALLLSLPPVAGQKEPERKPKGERQKENHAGVTKEHID